MSEVKRIRLIRVLVTLAVFMLLSPLAVSSGIVSAVSLNIGDVVEVINTQGWFVTVRDAPDGDSTGLVGIGTRGIVLDGPVDLGSSYSSLWWKVRFEEGFEEGFEGWTEDRGYAGAAYPGATWTVKDYLQKVDITPSSRFNIGDSVIVATSDLSVGGNPPVLNASGEVHNGDTGQVIGGPFYGVPPGGYRFYHYWDIDYGSIKGWSAENWLLVDDNQTLVCSVYPSPASGVLPPSLTYYEGALVNTGLVVVFSLGAIDSDGTITTWELDVDGDGNADYSGTGMPPATQSHTYREGGTYNVIFTVSDGDSNSASSFTTINIIDTMSPPSPTCSISVTPQAGESPLEVVFSLDADDFGGAINAWVLDVGEEGINNYTGEGIPPPTITHTYTTAGTHTAVLQVTGWGSSITATDSVTITVSAPVPEPPALSCSPVSLNFSTNENGANPDSQSLGVWNSGEGTLGWTASDNADWLSLSPMSGASNGETDDVTISVNISGMSPGTYEAVITVAASGAESTPHYIPVTLTIVESDIVTFPDPQLETAIRDTIGKTTGDITRTDLAGIAVLSARNRGITTLSGIEYCTGLRELDLSDNSIIDISPLAGCTQLVELTLTGNQIIDISALAGLSELEFVYLSGNQISDVSPLGGLQYLQQVVLLSNPLSEGSIETYIPQLLAGGVNVIYDSAETVPATPEITDSDSDTEPELSDFDSDAEPAITDVDTKGKLPVWGWITIGVAIGLVVAFGAWFTARKRKHAF